MWRAARGARDTGRRDWTGAAGGPRSCDRLGNVLSYQPYYLSAWGVARQEINYRRFLDIAELVSMRCGS